MRPGHRPPRAEPRGYLNGVAHYGPDLVRVEPRFSPDTEAARREALRAEAPFIEHFEYADTAGYATVQVAGSRVSVRIYTGLGRRLWKQVELSDLAGA